MTEETILELVKDGAAGVAEAGRFTGLSRTRLYELMQAGAIRSRVHIRTPWGSDANQWRDDEHIEASADSLLIIPPELLHTTEGVGVGRHILIDVFAPPRDDFIAKGWVHNAGDYVAQGNQSRGA